MNTRLLRAVYVCFEKRVWVGGEGVEVVSAACSQSHLTPVVRDGVCSHLSGCRRMHVREIDDEKKKTGTMNCFLARTWSKYASF